MSNCQCGMMRWVKSFSPRLLFLSQTHGVGSWHTFILSISHWTTWSPLDTPHLALLNPPFPLSPPHPSYPLPSLHPRMFGGLGSLRSPSLTTTVRRTPPTPVPSVKNTSLTPPLCNSAVELVDTIFVLSAAWSLTPSLSPSTCALTATTPPPRSPPLRRR